MKLDIMEKPYAIISAWFVFLWEFLGDKNLREPEAGDVIN